MKQTFKYALALAAALAFVGCQKEDPQNMNEDNVQEGVEFTISLPTETKTINDGLSTIWAEGDKVNVFHAVAGTQDYVNDGAFTLTSGTDFTGTLGAELDAAAQYDWYVSYPYNESMTTPKGMTINIPNDQTVSEGSMAHLCGDLCPLAGKATGLAGDAKVSVPMQHLVTVMKIKVTNYSPVAMDLNLVSFRADGCTHENETVSLINSDAQTITGTYTVDFTGDRVSYTQIDKGMGTGTSRPLVHLSEAKTLKLNESATVYMAALPFFVANGTSITIGMNKNDGGVGIHIYGKNVSCKAGQVCSVKQGSIKAPPFKDGINFYLGMKNGDGSYTYEDRWRCDLPEGYTLDKTFDFADLFTTCNTGDAWWSIANIGRTNQNDKAGNHENGGGEEAFQTLCDALTLAEGTTWARIWNGQEGWDTAFDVDYGDKSGLLIESYVGYNVGNWLIWYR